MHGCRMERAKAKSERKAREAETAKSERRSAGQKDVPDRRHFLSPAQDLPSQRVLFFRLHHPVTTTQKSRLFMHLDPSLQAASTLLHVWTTFLLNTYVSQPCHWLLGTTLSRIVQLSELSRFPILVLPFPSRNWRAGHKDKNELAAYARSSFSVVPVHRRTRPCSVTGGLPGHVAFPRNHLCSLKRTWDDCQYQL
jgi:hypothetical protein